MTHDEMIVVIQAHKEEREIECRRLNGIGGWEACTAHPSAMDFVHWEFRIKPEEKRPREWTVAATDFINSGGRTLLVVKDGPRIDFNYAEPFKVREVLE